MATSTRGQQYWHDPVRCGRCNVRDMEGLAASVLLIAILLGVLLVVGGLVYLLAQRLPKRSPEPQSPREERCGIYTGWSWLASHSRTPTSRLRGDIPAGERPGPVIDGLGDLPCPGVRAVAFPLGRYRRPVPCSRGAQARVPEVHRPCGREEDDKRGDRHHGFQARPLPSAIVST